MAILTLFWRENWSKIQELPLGIEPGTLEIVNSRLVNISINQSITFVVEVWTWSMPQKPPLGSVQAALLKRWLCTSYKCCRWKGEYRWVGILSGPGVETGSPSDRLSRLAQRFIATAPFFHNPDICFSGYFKINPW